MIEKIEVVRQAINNLVNERSIVKAQEIGYKQEILAEDIKFHLVNMLADNVSRVVDKFIAGQIEHGGDIRTRDFYAERRAEIIDLLVYNEAEHWKNTKHCGNELSYKKDLPSKLP